MQELGLGQSLVVRPHYPHMMPRDTVVWTRFLQQQRFGIKEVWYDVHVGQAISPAGDSDALLNSISAGVTRKRIDVVAAVGGGFWVIEVKPRADMHAVGQALVYSRLFVAEFKPPGLVFPMIVADEVDGDIVSQIDELGVGVIINS